MLRYLKGSPLLGLFFFVDNTLQVKGFCDSDWVLCLDTRRCLTGYCIFIGNALILWKTKKQNIISRSTAEGEYRTMVATFYELQWVTYILCDLQIPIHTPISLFHDN